MEYQIIICLLLLLVIHKFGQKADPYYFSLKSFTSYLEGNEVDTTHSPEMDPAPYWFWNSWKNGSNGDTYRERIYPVVLDTIEQKVNGVSFGPVVDLFGGDGEFIELLRNSSLPEACEYHVMDNNQPSLDLAKKRIAVGDNTTVVHAVDLVSESNIFKNLPRPSLVTAIGGLCASIVDRTQGRSISSQVYKALQGGGLFVVTGFTPVVLNASDFSQIGFKVEQMSIPENVVSFTRPDQLYVLRK